MGEACPVKRVSQSCVEGEAMRSKLKLPGSFCACSAPHEHVLCR